MKVHNLILGTAFLLTIAANTYAASFDCRKASSELEKLICSDDELSRLDESLSKAYREALKRTDIKDKIIKSQRQWLKNERDACHNAECLKTAHEIRIKELLSLSSHALVTSSLSHRNTSPPDKPVSDTYSRTDFMRDWSAVKETYKRAESKMILSVKDKNTFQFDASIVGSNLHTCTLSGLAVRRGPYFEYVGNEPMFTAPDDCVLKFWFQGDSVRLEHAPGKCRGPCGEHTMFGGAVLYRSGTIRHVTPTVVPDAAKNRAPGSP
jgi:uncharacterized protein